MPVSPPTGLNSYSLYNGDQAKRIWKTLSFRIKRIYWFIAMGTCPLWLQKMEQIAWLTLEIRLTLFVLFSRSIAKTHPFFTKLLPWIAYPLPFLSQDLSPAIQVWEQICDLSRIKQNSYLTHTYSFDTICPALHSLVMLLHEFKNKKKQILPPQTSLQSQ